MPALSLMNQGRPIPTVICSDDPLFRDMLELSLRTVGNINIVGSMANGSEALMACHEANASLLIVHDNLPDMLAHMVIDRLAQQGDSCKTMVIESHHHSVHLPRWGSADILGVVPARSRFQVILDTIHKYLIQESSVGTNRIDAVSLTKREHDVLSRIGMGMKTQEIADELNLSMYTVLTHRRNLCRKLGHSGSKLVRIATEYLAQQQISSRRSDADFPMRSATGAGNGQCLQAPDSSYR